MWSSSRLTSVLSNVWYPSRPPQNTENKVMIIDMISSFLRILSIFHQVNDSRLHFFPTGGLENLLSFHSFKNSNHIQISAFMLFYPQHIWAPTKIFCSEFLSNLQSLLDLCSSMGKCMSIRVGGCSIHIPVNNNTIFLLKVVATTH